jgi:hypothetical protein
MTLTEYKEIIRDSGCIICSGPAELHHPRAFAGMGQKSPEGLLIPLCHNHHNGGIPGVSFHADKTLFERNYGTEPFLLHKTWIRFIAEL